MIDFSDLKEKFSHKIDYFTRLENRANIAISMISSKDNVGVQRLLEAIEKELIKINSILLEKREMTKEERDCLIVERDCFEWMTRYFDSAETILKNTNRIVNKYREL